MSTSANYPTLSPSLLLDFANTQALDPRVTFTRSTTGTYYNGVTSALAEQNTITNSNFNWYVSGGTGTATTNATTAPDGTTTAGSLVPANGATQFAGFSNLSPTPAANSYTVSVYAKANGFNYMAIGYDNSSTIVEANLSAGTISGGTGSIVNAGNGWYRVIATYSSYTNNSPYFQVRQTSGSATLTTADGVKGIYLWGMQAEQRSSVTAYNATTSAAITNYIPVLQTAAANVPRFDYDPVAGISLGLLIEQQSTNICLYSSAYDNAAWVKQNLNITTAADIAPDGTQTAELAYATSTNATHATYTANFSASASTSYTASVYAKAQGLNFLCMRFDDQATNLVSSCFNLSTGTISTAAAGLGTFTNLSSAITSVGNGWYRCSITATTASTTNSLRIVLFVNNVTSDYNGAVYAGNGYSGIYMWGAQLEALSFQTSYIPTTTAAVTRTADYAVMTGTNLTSWFNQSQGTLYGSYDVLQTNGRIGSFWLNANASRLLDIYNSGPNIGIYASNGINASIGTYVNNSKVAGTYSNTSYTGSLNGASVVTFTPTMPLTTIDTFGIGNYYNSSNSFTNGHIKKLAYYPQALSNTNLQALTGS
jgi:hypothetical protein